MGENVVVDNFIFSLSPTWCVRMSCTGEREVERV